MNHIFNEEKLVELADEYGLGIGNLEMEEGAPVAFYLDRDVQDTSLYNIARVIVQAETQTLLAHCSLCNAKGHISSDKGVSYSNLQQAMKDIKDRFELLRAPYQPQKKTERKPKSSPIRFIH